jgi:hypothetical protein
MSNHESQESRLATGPRRIRPLVIGGIITLLLLVAGSLVYYWVDWHDARADGTYQSFEVFLQTYEDFLDSIKAGRLDATYQMMAASFRERVSQDDFARRARKYLAFVRKRGSRCIGGPVTGPLNPGYRARNQMTAVEDWEDRHRNQLQMVIKVVQEDSFFQRRPSPPQVAEFTVSEFPRGSRGNDGIR